MRAFRTVLLGVGGLLAVAAVPAASAETLDFEDLVLGSTINLDQSWVSGGVTITGRTFFTGGGNPVDNFAQVQNQFSAGGSGNELWTDNLNLEFDFGSPIVELSLKYGEYGGNVNMVVNGTLLNESNLFDMNGMTVDGVDITVTANGNPGDSDGELTLLGTINMFSIGGQEFAVDDVTYFIPEPGTVVLMLCAAGVMGLRRR